METGDHHDTAAMVQHTKCDEDSTDDDLDLDAKSPRRPQHSSPSSTLPKPSRNGSSKTLAVSAGLNHIASMPAKSPAKKLGSIRPKNLPTPMPERDEVEEVKPPHDSVASSGSSIAQTNPVAVAETSKPKVKRKIGSKKCPPDLEADRDRGEPTTCLTDSTTGVEMQNAQNSVEIPSRDCPAGIESEAPQLLQPAQVRASRETSEERADRKRRLLSTQLEVQSKVTAKKKRKF